MSSSWQVHEPLHLAQRLRFSGPVTESSSLFQTGISRKWGVFTPQTKGSANSLPKA